MVTFRAGVRVVSRPSPWGLRHLNQRWLRWRGASRALETTVTFRAQVRVVSRPSPWGLGHLNQRRARAGVALVEVARR